MFGPIPSVAAEVSFSSSSPASQNMQVFLTSPVTKDDRIEIEDDALETGEVYFSIYMKTVINSVIPYVHFRTYYQHLFVYFPFFYDKKYSRN